jgi:hypothetical protein
MKWVVAAGLVFASGAAQAEVVSAGPNGFHVRQSVQMVVPQQAAYAAFGQVGSWWNPEHSYSGKSANLSMALTTGGCFCERLDNGGGIEHMRVTFVDPGKRILMTGSLGPLLYEATNGVMDVQIKSIAGGSQLMIDYRVSGFFNGGADKLAPIVDQVLADQMRRFRTYATARPRY